MFGNCDLTVTLTFDAEDFAHLKAMQGFTAGFPTEALNGSSLGEVCEALQEALVNLNCTFRDAGKRREAAAKQIEALLARLQPTKP